MLDENFRCSAKQIDSIIRVVVNTLLLSKEITYTKLNVISLINCIVLKLQVALLIAEYLHEIIKLAKSSSAIVKGPILQQIKTTPDVDLATLDYVTLFCKNDANYIVRMMSAILKKN